MNGRIYDPLLGRFLSADVYVDGPGNLQGYNRYSYLKNNPLNGTDPSGYFGYYPGFENDVRGANQVLSHPRVQGGLKVVGGGVEVVGGAIGILAPEPASTAAGVVVAAHGVDTVQAGIRQLWTGEEVNSFTQDGITQAAVVAGASPETAETIGMVGDAVVGGADSIIAIKNIVDNLPAFIKRLSGDAPTTTNLANTVETSAQASDGMTVYRGVDADAGPGLENANRGFTEPRGASDNPGGHAGGATEQSSYTSWTTDRAVADEAATAAGPGGVVLRQNISGSVYDAAPKFNHLGESEVLLKGTQSGDVLQPSTQPLWFRHLPPDERNLPFE
jgi:hypothetical protein